MECYACDQEGTRRCPRCGNSYCPDHGAGFCAQCLDPATGAPSGTVFRVALFGLLAASVLALWLLVRPPSLPGETSAIREPTATAAAAARTPAPGSGTPSPAEGTATAAGTPAPTAAPTPGPATPIDYTVQEGDTWYEIAAVYGVSAEDLAAANGFTLDDFLHPGDVLRIPQ